MILSLPSKLTQPKVEAMSVKLRKKALADGRQSLYLDIYHNGRRSYDFLKLYLGKDKAANKETRRLADSIRAKKELELQSQQHGFVPSFKGQVDFIQYFEQLARSKNQSDTAWRNTLKHLKEFTGGSIRLAAVDERWLELFKEYLLTQVAQTTARTYFKKIIATLRRAVKDRLIVRNPAEYIDQIPPVETKRAFLTIEELQQLAHSPCKYRDVKRAFLFSCFAGLRISDVQRLKWKNVNGTGLEFRQQKTNGVEYLPLSKQAHELLGDSGDPEEHVFMLPCLVTIEKTLQRWAADAGIDKHITFHVSRHTFATLALTNDVDLYTVSKLLGHKNIQTTQIYAKIIDKKKQEAVDRLPGIEL